MDQKAVKRKIRAAWKAVTTEGHRRLIEGDQWRIAVYPEGFGSRPLPEAFPEKESVRIVTFSLSDRDILGDLDGVKIVVATPSPAA